MYMDEFALALKELAILGVEDIETEPAELPGFLYVKNVKIEGDHKLLLKVVDDVIKEVVLLRKKGPRRIDPEEFFRELGRAAYDGKGAKLS
jgi:hypothetical protein